MLLAADWALFR